MVTFNRICPQLNTSRFLGSFLSQKTYPEKFLRPEVILSRSYLRKCNVWLPVKCYIMQPVSPNYNFVAKLYLVSIGKGKDPNIRIKMHQTLFLIFTTIYYLPYISWVDVIYLTCLVSLKSPCCLVWVFCASTPQFKKQNYENRT